MDDLGRRPVSTLLDPSVPAILFRLGPWTDHPDPELPRRGHGYRIGMDEAELRDSTRGWWVIDQNRAATYPFAAAVHGGIVRGVWEIDHASWRRWLHPTVGKSAVRWGFDVRTAPPEVQAAFVDKVVPAARPDGKRLFGTGSVVAYWPR